MIDNEKFNFTFSYSLADKIVSGEIWVDDVDQPAQAIFKLSNGIHHFAGKRVSHEGVLEWFKEHIEEASPCVLFADAEWEEFIDKEQLHKTKIQRVGYKFDKGRYNKLKAYTIPEGLRLKRIESSLISKSKQYPEKFYKLYWENKENFLSKGVGFGLLNKEDEIIGEVVSSYFAGRYGDPDIFISEDHRGNGYGTLLARAFIDECLERGVCPKWECDMTNIESQQLAERLGFIKIGSHPLYVMN
ncbi:GNAT family N-acetyltransferase [Bacillus sp. Marseille-Q1617]|uniref:GNAT family N-acetyltransferase n=1 Tax=Bacillus sp. Marseille-Q1617 TaxID=2736887 RepID=UPI00158C5C96|nr:GNAT family N-acetyltransferase [Bacillus sp. Marseille-Q1617]